MRKILAVLTLVTIGTVASVAPAYACGGGGWANCGGGGGGYTGGGGGGHVPVDEPSGLLLLAPVVAAFAARMAFKRKSA